MQGDGPQQPRPPQLQDPEGQVAPLCNTNTRSLVIHRVGSEPKERAESWAELTVAAAPQQVVEVEDAVEEKVQKKK